MRQKKKEKKREFFIKAAKKAFIKRGIVSTNMEDISLNTGTSRTALYYYFKSKEDILKAIILETREKLMRRLKKNMKSVKNKKKFFLLLVDTVHWLAKNEKEALTIILRLKLKDSESNLPKLKDFMKHIEKKIISEIISMMNDKNLEISEKDMTLIFDYLTGLSFFIMIGMPERFLNVMNESFLKEFERF